MKNTLNALNFNFKFLIIDVLVGTMTEDPEKNPEISTNQVTFIAENKIQYSVGETSYIMQCTKTEKDRKYFSCINRRFESSNPKKCDATGILNTNNGIYTAKKPHAQCANIEETKVDNSYNIQKNLLLSEVQKLVWDCLV